MIKRIKRKAEIRVWCRIIPRIQIGWEPAVQAAAPLKRVLVFLWTQQVYDKPISMFSLNIRQAAYNHIRVRQQAEDSYFSPLLNVASHYVTQLCLHPQVNRDMQKL